MRGQQGEARDLDKTDCETHLQDMRDKTFRLNVGDEEARSECGIALKLPLQVTGVTLTQILTRKWRKSNVRESEEQRVRGAKDILSVRHI